MHSGRENSVGMMLPAAAGMMLLCHAGGLGQGSVMARRSLPATLHSLDWASVISIRLATALGMKSRVVVRIGLSVRPRRPVRSSHNERWWPSRLVATADYLNIA